MIEVIPIPSFVVQFLLLFPFFILFLSVVFESVRSIHNPMTVANSKGSKKPGTAKSILASPVLAGLSRQEIRVADFVPRVKFFSAC